MKIDLHVHSKFSKRPSQWILQKLDCPESFTEPMRIYETARRLGMDMVTITDHNRIDGALSIAHLPGAFVSEEITAYFPEDRCKLHVLAFDIDEEIHRDVQAVRENVYELVEYLRGRGVVHVCAHPLYGVNDRLTLDHFERMLLLFRNFEINGTRDDQQNVSLRMILSALTRKDVERLADKHGLEPGFDEPWRKNVTGGSDDHSALNICRYHTDVPHASSLEEFLRGVETGAARAVGQSSNPRTLAHNLYSIAYQYYKNRLGFQKYVAKDVFLRFVDRFLEPAPQEEPGMVARFQAMLHGGRRRLGRRGPAPTSVKELLRYEAEKLIADDPRLLDFARTGGAGSPASAPKAPEDEWRDFVGRAANKVCARFGDHLLNNVAGADLFDIFSSVGSAGALYAALAPYFVAYGVFTKDRRFCKLAVSRFLRHEGEAGEAAPVKVAHFTDTFYEVNGVAKTLRRQAEMARRTGKNLTVVTCRVEEARDGIGVRNFTPIGVYSLPEYPAQKIFYPPILDMLDYVFEEDFTHIHSATPGPLGLAALLVARILKLPIHGTYHTQIPQYAQLLTGDEEMEAMMWKFVVWYYNQMDRVYVPSMATGRELVERGVEEGKIMLFPRGVDVALFDPAKRNGFLKHGYGVEEGEATLLYVGRVSKEKNLRLLADAYREIVGRRENVRLVIVGDGPYLEEMQRELAGTQAVFTGVLDGEELAQAYASSDLFVFPSATDTFGNVVLEAQASGLPVVVADEGGPRENLVDGETGLVVEAGSLEGLVRAVESLLDDPARRRAMGVAARRSMAERSFEKAFDETWSLYSAASARATYGPTDRKSPFAS